MSNDEYALSSWVEVVQLFFWALWALLPVHCIVSIAGQKFRDWTVVAAALLLAWCGSLVLLLPSVLVIYSESQPPPEERMKHWGLMLLLLLAAHGVLRLAGGRRS